MRFTPSVRLVFLLTMLLTTTQAVGHGHTHARDVPTGMLHTAVWIYSAWGRDITGLACWLQDPAGRWRLELAVAEADPDEQELPVSLLEQVGEGWTVVSVDGTETFVQPWRDKLESIRSYEANMVSAMLVLALSGPESISNLQFTGAGVEFTGQRRNLARLPWESQAGTQALLIVDWPGTHETGLKETMEGRGLGRGGQGEIWRVDFSMPGVWRLSSSRRSGVLHVNGGPDWSVAYDPDDVFLPMWPLAELLQFEPISEHGMGTRHAPPE